MESPLFQWIRTDFKEVGPYDGLNIHKAELLKRGVLVVKGEGAHSFLGILTPKDVLAHPHILVIDCLSPKPMLDATSNTVKAMKQMLKSNETVLPFAENGVFKGLLFLDDLVQHIYGQSLNHVKKLIKNKQKIKETDHVLEALYNSTNSVRFLVDKDYKILFFNKKASQNALALLDKEIKLGDSLTDYALVATERNDSTFKADFEKALGGEMVSREREILYEHKKFWFKTEFYPVYMENELIGVSINTFDITPKKEAAYYIENQNKAMRDLIGFQSHRVRRPVANIMGLVQVLDKEELSDHNAIIIEKLDLAAKELDEVIRLVVEQAGDWIRRDGLSPKLLQ